MQITREKGTETRAMLHFLLPSPLNSGYRAESLPCYISPLFLPLPSDIAVAKWIHQRYHVILNVAQPWEGEVVHFSSYCQTSPIFVNILHLVCDVRIGYEVISCAALTYYVSFLTLHPRKRKKKNEHRIDIGNLMKQVVQKTFWLIS